MNYSFDYKQSKDGYKDMVQALISISEYPPIAETNNGDRYYEQMREEASLVLIKLGLKHEVNDED